MAINVLFAQNFVQFGPRKGPLESFGIYAAYYQPVGQRLLLVKSISEVGSMGRDKSTKIGK